jgi:hypothetical protein
MPNHIEYRGFIQSYGELVDRLTTVIYLLPLASADTKIRDIPIKLTALWDTGAMMTCMKPRLREQLTLRVITPNPPMTISGVGGTVRADRTIASIFLAATFVVEYCPIYVLDFPGNADLIIGMDIIAMGDFAVCNTNGATSFSFAMPPFPDRINLADKADLLNKQNEPPKNPPTRGS